MKYADIVTRVGLMNDKELEGTQKLADMKRTFKEDVISEQYKNDGYYSDKTGEPLAYKLAKQYIQMPKVNWRALADEKGDAYNIKVGHGYTWWFRHGSDQHKRICAFVESKRDKETDDEIMMFTMKQGRPQYPGISFATFKCQPAESQFKMYVLK